MIKEHSAEKTALRVSLTSIVASIVLAAVKLTTGLIGHSAAMISDAANSISDIVTYTVVMGGVAASGRKADGNHQYGHDKIESIVAVVLALVIFTTGVAIGINGGRMLMQPETIVAPTLLPAFGALLSMSVKLLLYWRVRKAWKETHFSSLQALCGDHLSDVFASGGTLAGVIGARSGLPVMDPIAAIVIALLIVKSAIEIFRNASNVLLDGSVDPATIEHLRMSIVKNPRVKQIDLLRTRSTGARYYVEVEICCCRNLSLEVAHAVAQDVHDRIERDFPQVKHVMVHTNPCTGDEDFCNNCVEQSV